LAFDSWKVKESSNSFTFTLKGKSYKGCPWDSVVGAELDDFVTSNPSFFFIGFMAVGILVLVLGSRNLKMTIFFSGFSVTQIIIWMICFTLFVQKETPDWAQWAIMGISSMLGVVNGYFLLKQHPKLSKFLVSFWLGAVIALMIYQTVLVHIPFIYHQLIMIVAVLTGGSITGTLAKYYEKHTVIWSSSLAGSYMTLRALSFYLGGWIPETQMANYVARVGWTEIPGAFWFYMTGVVMMTLVGVKIQKMI